MTIKEKCELKISLRGHVELLALFAVCSHGLEEMFRDGGEGRSESPGFLVGFFTLWNIWYVAGQTGIEAETLDAMERRLMFLAKLLPEFSDYANVGEVVDFVATLIQSEE